MEKSISDNLKNMGNFIYKYKILLVLLIAFIAIAVIWLLKNREIRQTKEIAQKQYINRQHEELKLLVKPYVWAIRKEMLTKNYQQVNLYGADMIHEKHIQSIMVADKNGIIISATDKKSEGKNIYALVDKASLKVDSTNIYKLNDSVIVVSSPVMGFNNRLGTLTIYKKIDTITY